MSPRCSVQGPWQMDTAAPFHRRGDGSPRRLAPPRSHDCRPRRRESDTGSLTSRLALPRGPAPGPFLPAPHLGQHHPAPPPSTRTLQGGSSVPRNRRALEHPERKSQGSRRRPLSERRPGWVEAPGPARKDGEKQDKDVGTTLGPGPARAGDAGRARADRDVVGRGARQPRSAPAAAPTGRSWRPHRRDRT